MTTIVDKVLRVVLYIRVSRDEQAQRGFSIPDQKRELLAHAKREGWQIVDVIVDDGYSGAVGVRPGLDRVMRLAETGKIDAVAAKKRNRLFRSRYYRMMYERDLKELGVALIALDDTGNRFADAMQDEFGDWYREELTKNTVAGRMEKARSGKLIRYRTPIFGFTYTADGCAFVVVPEQMTIVERVIRAVAEGKTLYAVQKEMENDAIPAPSGGNRWNASTIRGMVREDAYKPIPYPEIEPLLTREARERLDSSAEYGIVRYPKHKVITLEPDASNGYKRKQKATSRPEKEQIPIAVVSSGINRNLIDAARSRIENNRPHRKKHDREYELHGIVKCKECESSIIASRKNNGTREYFYYRCARNERHGNAECSHNKGHRAQELERTVLNALLDVVKDKDDLIARVRQDHEHKRRNLARLHADSEGLQHRLDALERQKANLQRAFAADALSLDDLIARTAEIDGERGHLERLLTESVNREKRLRTLEAERDKAIAMIRKGQWAPLGITDPKKRNERYREIGLSVKVDNEENISLSWTGGERTVMSTEDTISRSGSPWKMACSTCSPARATAPTG